MEAKQNFFEKHPTKSIIGINLLGLVLFALLVNLKIEIGAWTEDEPKSLWTMTKQWYFGRIIDANVGRFIKLREYRPNTVKFDQPSRDYLSQIAPNSIERKPYPIRTDQHGFIMGPEPHHPTTDLSFVFLGGSTTECLYVDEDKRFPYLVRKHLEEVSGKKINTYNGGVSANESMHSLNILMNKVLPMKPDVVVLMHNINDLTILRWQGSYHYQVSHKSHLQTSRNVFTRYEFPPKEQPSLDEEIKQEFRANLRTFIAITKIRGIMPVLMTQANRVEGLALYPEFNQIIRDVAEEEQVMLIDLAGLVPKETRFLYDSYHYTAEGSQLAAALISEHLKGLVVHDSGFA